eukprot:gene15093-biopygen18676
MLHAPPKQGYAKITPQRGAEQSHHIIIARWSDSRPKGVIAASRLKTPSSRNLGAWLTPPTPLGIPAIPGKRGVAGVAGSPGHPAPPAAAT